MVDFGALPPEINSARMYFGPGAAPMMAAAAAWNELAVELGAAACACAAATVDLRETWEGPSSASMEMAIEPYIAWINETAAQAEQSAIQATAAAAAYEAAFAVTVPPPVIEANRTLLMSLIATNFLGQNSSAIAAAEAAYAEMWAQDAAAMYGYAASSSAATTLTRFNQAPKVTSQSAAAARAAGSAAAGEARTVVSQLMSALGQQLHSLASAGPLSAGTTSSGTEGALSPLLTAFSDFNILTGPINPVWQWTYAAFRQGHFILRAKADFERHAGGGSGEAPRLVETAPASRPPAPASRGPVDAVIGRATLVGKLSVPPAWASAESASDAVAEMPRAVGTGFRALPGWAHAPTNTPAGFPPGAISSIRAAPAAGKKVLAMRDRRFKMPRPATGG
ncbi:PPE family protein [Mycolicibacter icosiumassiliensis]|uniref:PPE family protein n=1 Tax=Mycolicibacter icosiumassiliensis TaxID=1792835 RepID=UPI000833043D|nr:PPE family protein [Mycolicibacter icosiumassiliensis]